VFPTRISPLLRFLLLLKLTAFLLALEDLISVLAHYTVVTLGGWSIGQTIYCLVLDLLVAFVCFLYSPRFVWVLNRKLV
jgi:hypothetical protein